MQPTVTPSVSFRGQDPEEPRELPSNSIEANQTPSTAGTSLSPPAAESTTPPIPESNIPSSAPPTSTPTMPADTSPAGSGEDGDQASSATPAGGNSSGPDEAATVSPSLVLDSSVSPLILPTELQVPPGTSPFSISPSSSSFIITPNTPIASSQASDVPTGPDLGLPSESALPSFSIGTPSFLPPEASASPTVFDVAPSSSIGFPDAVTPEVSSTNTPGVSSGVESDVSPSSGTSFSSPVAQASFQGGETPSTTTEETPSSDTPEDETPEGTPGVNQDPSVMVTPVFGSPALPVTSSSAEPSGGIPDVTGGPNESQLPDSSLSPNGSGIVSALPASPDFTETDRPPSDESTPPFSSAQPSSPVSSDLPASPFLSPSFGVEGSVPPSGSVAESILPTPDGFESVPASTVPLSSSSPSVSSSEIGRLPSASVLPSISPALTGEPVESISQATISESADVPSVSLTPEGSSSVDFPDVSVSALPVASGIVEPSISTLPGESIPPLGSGFSPVPSESWLSSTTPEPDDNGPGTDVVESPGNIPNDSADPSPAPDDLPTNAGDPSASANALPPLSSTSVDPSTSAGFQSTEPDATNEVTSPVSSPEGTGIPSPSVLPPELITSTPLSSGDDSGVSVSPTMSSSPLYQSPDSSSGASASQTATSMPSVFPLQTETGKSPPFISNEPPIASESVEPSESTPSSTSGGTVQPSPSLSPSISVSPSITPSAFPSLKPPPSDTAPPVPPRNPIGPDGKRSPSPGVDIITGSGGNVGQGDSGVVPPTATGAAGAGTSTTGGLPGGVGGLSGIAVGSLIVLVIVGAVLYKTCAVLPTSGFAITSIFGNSEDDNGKSGLSSDIGLGNGDDSPWDQAWKSASELPEGAVLEGERVAAGIGGEFAGILKPGAARVRPPQVITRLAVPGMCMAFSQLSPESMESEMMSMDSGESVVQVSTVGSQGPSSQEGIPAVPRGIGKGAGPIIVAGELPKIDLLFVFDSSGSMSWREYRQVKEVITRPRGLLDEVMQRAHVGSRVGFIEYAYDSVVVSELDRDQDTVRRRILSSFQGDANNWDHDGMYIYEVGEEVGGNALRKVNSLVQHEDADEEMVRSPSVVSEGDIDGPPTVQAREVPPAMNGMSREAHLALRWSRYEMLPPVANKRIQAQLQSVVRLRRVVVVNAGELTKGGHSSCGVDAAVAEKVEMEKAGIRVITVGVGNSCEKDLSRVASQKYHMHVEDVDKVESVVEELAGMIVKADMKHDGRFALHSPAILKKRKKKRERSMKEKKQNAVYRAVKAGSIDPAKSISKGLPRRASELPPWFTEVDVE